MRYYIDNGMGNLVERHWCDNPGCRSWVTRGAIVVIHVVLLNGHEYCSNKCEQAAALRGYPHNTMKFETKEVVKARCDVCGNTYTDQSDIASIQRLISIEGFARCPVYHCNGHMVISKARLRYHNETKGGS